MGEGGRKTTDTNHKTETKYLFSTKIKTVDETRNCLSVIVSNLSKFFALMYKCTFNIDYIALLKCSLFIFKYHLRLYILPFFTDFIWLGGQ